MTCDINVVSNIEKCIENPEQRKYHAVLLYYDFFFAKFFPFCNIKIL